MSALCSCNGIVAPKLHFRKLIAIAGMYMIWFSIWVYIYLEMAVC